MKDNGIRIDPVSIFQTGCPKPIRSYKADTHGNVVGYLGRQRAIEFGNDQGAEQRASEWVNDPNPAENPPTPLSKKCFI